TVRRSANSISARRNALKFSKRRRFRIGIGEDCFYRVCVPRGPPNCHPWIRTYLGRKLNQPLYLFLPASHSSLYSLGKPRSSWTYTPLQLRVAEAPCAQFLLLTLSASIDAALHFSALDILGRASMFRPYAKAQDASR